MVRILGTRNWPSSRLTGPERLLDEVPFDQLPISDVDRAVLADLFHRFEGMPANYCAHNHGASRERWLLRPSWPGGGSDGIRPSQSGLGIRIRREVANNE